MAAEVGDDRDMRQDLSFYRAFPSVQAVAVCVKVGVEIRVPKKTFPEVGI
jgi:hypothetical protein